LTIEHFIFTHHKQHRATIYNQAYYSCWKGSRSISQESFECLEKMARSWRAKTKSKRRRLVEFIGLRLGFKTLQFYCRTLVMRKNLNFEIFSIR